MYHSKSTRKPPLLTAPAEIRQIIYSFLIAEDELDLSRIRLYRSGNASAPEVAPSSVIHFRNLVQAFRALEDEVLGCVDKHWGHVQANLADIDKLPEVIKVAGCHLIQKLEMCMEGGMLHFPRPNWPRFLDRFIKDMPYLSSLKLYSRWSIEADKTDMSLDINGGATVTRHEYHRMRLLRFLSFLVLRHPNLNLLIWAAKCQARRQIEHGMITERFVAEKKSSEVHKWETAVQSMAWSFPEDWKIEYDPPVEMVCIGYVEDEVLNSRAIRRLLANELAEAHLSNFVVRAAKGMTKDDILSSEMPENDSVLSEIDRREYLDQSSPHPDDTIQRQRQRQRSSRIVVWPRREQPGGGRKASHKSRGRNSPAR